MQNIIVLISGNGTNLEAILNSCHNKILNAKVRLVISNRKDAFGLIRAANYEVDNLYLTYDKNRYLKREDYDIDLISVINEHEYDLIVLAGWMHILSKEFLSRVRAPIINLHPALPGKFPGKDAIGQAWEAFHQGLIRKTGIMVHHVVEEIDAGAVINTHDVSITKNDTFESLKSRITYYEKPLLISSIEKVLYSLNVLIAYFFIFTPHIMLVK